LRGGLPYDDKITRIIIFLKGCSMQKFSGQEIRKAFIDFFKSKGHTFVPSSSLVPGGDQTLLFTNAGMVQFKDVFLGVDKRPYSRAVNSQKCMRVSGKHNDLEDVGKDGTHHTFFEMLGNWSFGDYYKEEAIFWAWELLTEIWKMEKSRLWVTCFKDEQNKIPTDDEAADIWKKQPGLDPNHIIFLGRKENFWEMAETGPCGPCSEIYIDLGEESCLKRNDQGHVCKIGNDCRRFLEFWNLVFIQYNRVNSSELLPLPFKHVDTGMGLERIVSILQGEKTNYETDLFAPLMDVVMKLSGQSITDRNKNPVPYRVIADHCRAATFLIADGVVPGNIGRNYVCRMIIRRAARFGGKLGLTQPFLAKVGCVVIEKYGLAFPELVKNRETILENLTSEEEKYISTIENGQIYLQEQLDALIKEKKTILSGEKAFDLYATHGLPLEIARDIAQEQGLGVEEKGFMDALEKHRINSGAGRVFGNSNASSAEVYGTLMSILISENKIINNEIAYDPYSSKSNAGVLVGIIVDGKIVEKANLGSKVEVVVPATCFYVESGGQVSDTGEIISKDHKWEIRINDVKKTAPGLIVHVGEVTKGNPKIGDEVVVSVDAHRRLNIMRNHTATHLLHSKLREILGSHVRQAGSLVAADRLRFDFTHPKAVTKQELEKVEAAVNKLILENYQLRFNIQSRDEAVNYGAMALFGEKYGEEVRTVSIGDDVKYSYELCGGTHVDQTGNIGTFFIVNESSVAAGIRRIEAITGDAAYENISQSIKILREISRQLSSTIEELPIKIQKIVEDNAEYQKNNKEFTFLSLNAEYEKNKNHDLYKKDDVTIYITSLQNGDIESFKKIADIFKTQYKTGVIVLGTVEEKTNRALIVMATTEDLIKNKNINSVEIVKEIGKIINGGGGGRANLAQAGGSDTSKLNDALHKIRTILQEKI